MSAITVAISGTGKMGREVLAGLCRDQETQPVGVLGRSAGGESLPLPDGSGAVAYGWEPEAFLSRLRPQVVVDFSNAQRTPAVAEAALAAGAHLVVGTSGLSESFLAELDRQFAAQGLGAVVAPNFAIGAVLMIHLAAVAARYFDYAEVIEMHQERKADAPSGTAIATAKAMVESRGRPFQYAPTLKETIAGSRGSLVDGVAIHSVRVPGLVAHQLTIFGGPGQTLTIRHDSTSRESFIPGVLLAVKEVGRRRGLVFGLEKLLGLT